MEVKKVFLHDLQIAKALLDRDEQVTRKYFYQQCYPLFKSIYDNYYTDCTCCKEFIDEIYVLVLAPSKTTGKCQLENFRGESTLASWLKTACLYYCYKQFDLKEKMPKYERLPHSNEKEFDEDGDRNDEIYGSIEIDLSNLEREDAITRLRQLPNKRYGELLRLRYVESLTNEETANKLGTTMENYYNLHKRAKEQYDKVHGKEGRHA